MNICSKGKRSENIIIVAIELESLLQQMYTEQMQNIVSERGKDGE